MSIKDLIPLGAEKVKFYSLDRILKENAYYNVIIGERSNGKTYSVEEYALKDFCENGRQLALVRRWKEDFIGKRGHQMFDSIVANGLIEKYTHGKWNRIKYYSSMWYLSRWDEDLNKEVMDNVPFCYGFSLAAFEHDKSTSYPNIGTIMFDEFLTRSNYLVDEFVIFCNVISTIVRHRDDVKIFMLGNTVNKYAPYFKEMGLRHITEMQPGDIDVYTYGDSKLRVAIEYAESPNKKGKPSDLYFAFDNPKLKMITGGAWEIDLYPHCPTKFSHKDIQFIYFIEWEQEILQCEVVFKDNTFFTYIHRKTGVIKNESTDIVFSVDFSHRPNFRRNIMKPQDNLGNKIKWFFSNEKVFYQDNEVGESVRNYINWCGGTIKK